MNRVMVLGSGGSGKSTLSQVLGKILSLPVIHLDKFYWKPNWVPTPNEEWDKIVENFTMKEQWIIDGNYSRTMDIRIARADLIIYLDMPRWLCMYRILKRRVMYHNTVFTHRAIRPSVRPRYFEEVKSGGQPCEPNRVAAGSSGALRFSGS